MAKTATKPAIVGRDQLARLTVAHHSMQEDINRQVAAKLATLLGGLSDLSDQSADAFVAGAVPVVQAGQRQAANLAAGYIRSLVTGPTRDRPVNLDLRKMLVTKNTDWIGSPIIRGRTKLAEGESWRSAIDAAGSYAGALSSTELQRSQRLGLDTAATAAKIEARWQKVLSSDPCPWCIDVAGGSYHAADNVPFHERDLCSVAPLFD